MTDAETVPSRQEQSIADVIAGRCLLGWEGLQGEKRVREEDTDTVPEAETQGRTRALRNRL